jgi:hypothetical protein
MPTPDGGDSPQRALLVAVAAMAGVALLVGLAIGGAMITVANVAGLGGETGESRGGGQETLVIPKYKPTETVDADLGLPKPSATKEREPKPSKEPSPRTDRIKLFVAPQSVSPGERINFNGVYVDGEGVALQVQRKEGGTWVDFPVTATVRGGVFSTWIQTSRTGQSPFRVYDAGANRASNPVVVTVG